MEENKNQVKRTSVEVHAYNPITWEAEPEGSRVQDKPGIHSKSVSKTQNTTIPPSQKEQGVRGLAKDRLIY